VYLGNGYCRDSKNVYFDYMRYTSSTTPAECGARCKKTSGFRGFSMYEATYCYCWYEDGQVASDTSSDLYVYTAFAGTGQITQIYYTGYSTCYKFEPTNPADTETPTNKPTNSPTPSPTVAPTKKPTNHPTLAPVRFNFVIVIALAQQSQFQFPLTKFVMLCIFLYHTDTRRTCK
jgi:hypothetical protein